MKRQPGARKGTIVSTLRLRGSNLGASVFWALCVGLAAGLPLGAQTLHCGDVVHGTIASPGQIDSYSLDCVAGDVVRLTSISLNGVVGPDIGIYDSEGVLVGAFGYNDGFSTWKAGATGTYSVRVHDRENSNTGPYSLGVVFGTPKCAAAPLSCGQVLTNVITDPVQQHTYTFAGLAGEVIRLTSISLDGVVGPDIDIFDPTGVYAGGFGYNDGFKTFTVPTNGNYIVIVRPRANNNTGTYALGMVYATPKCAAITLSCGQVLTNVITAFAQQHTYTFAGLAGEVIRLTSISLDGVVGPDIDIFNPAGVYVGGFGYNDGFNTFRVPTNGNYLVIVRGRDNNNTGTYALGMVYATPKCAAIPLVCGKILTNVITDLAQQHTYSFTGVAGDVLRLISISLDGVVGPDIDIFNPAGVYVGGFGYNDGFNTFRVPTNGNYLAIVRGRGNNNTGTYSLGLVYATPKCAAMPLTCGKVFTNVITDLGQQHAYRLAGWAGAVIRLTSVSLDGVVAPDIDVFNSSGVYVGGFNHDDFVSTMTLTNTEALQVIVRDRGNDNTGIYSLEMVVMGGCFQLNLGSAVVRTQEVACLPLRARSGSPVVGVSFIVRAPADGLGSPILQTGTRFINATVLPGPDSQYLVQLQADPENPILGDEVVGSLCFLAVSNNSAFAPIPLYNLAVTNLEGFLPSRAGTGGRAVIVADRSLIESAIVTNQRVLTIYGKPNTAYEIARATDLAAPAPWTPTFTNLVPLSLFYSQTLTGPLSNAPVLLFRAREE